MKIWKLGKNFLSFHHQLIWIQRLIPVICKGYEITSCFHNYNDENGIVDTECNPIFLDANGNEYRCGYSDVAFVQLTMKDADEQLLEMKSDLF